LIISIKPPRLFLILGAGLFFISNTVWGASGDREKARIALAAGAYDEAIEYAAALITEDPADIDARLILAKAFISTGNDIAAAKEYDTVVSLEPGHPDGNYGLAVLAAERGDLGTALEYARAAVATDAEYVEAWLLIGKAAAATGDYEAAHDAYVEYLKRRPPTDDIYLELARVERQRREWDTAVQYYRLAAEAENRKADIDREIAATLTEAGKYEEALDAWAELDGLTAREAETVNGIGLRLLDGKEYEAAGRAFLIASEADPGKRIYSFNRGFTFHLEGDEERAEAVYRELADGHDPFPEAIYNLAVILDGRGDLEAAKAYYDNFLGVSANRPDLDDEAAMVEERLAEIEGGD
jgi:tetratricopeptide (TPR) repeat protein